MSQGRCHCGHSTAAHERTGSDRLCQYCPCGDYRPRPDQHEVCACSHQSLIHRRGIAACHAERCTCSNFRASGVQQPEPCSHTFGRDTAIDQVGNTRDVWLCGDCGYIKEFANISAPPRCHCGHTSAIHRRLADSCTRCSCLTFRSADGPLPEQGWQEKEMTLERLLEHQTNWHGTSAKTLSVEDVRRALRNTKIREEQEAADDEFEQTRERLRISLGRS